MSRLDREVSKLHLENVSLRSSIPPNALPSPNEIDQFVEEKTAQSYIDQVKKTLDFDEEDFTYLLSQPRIIALRFGELAVRKTSHKLLQAGLRDYQQQRFNNFVCNYDFIFGALQVINPLMIVDINKDTLIKSVDKPLQGIPELLGKRSSSTAESATIFINILREFEAQKTLLERDPSGFSLVDYTLDKIQQEFPRASQLLIAKLVIGGAQFGSTVYKEFYQSSIPRIS